MGARKKGEGQVRGKKRKGKRGSIRREKPRIDEEGEHENKEAGDGEQKEGEMKGRKGGGDARERENG